MIKLKIQSTKHVQTKQEMKQGVENFVNRGHQKSWLEEPHEIKLKLFDF